MTATRPAGRRAPIPPDALRAAFGAHRGARHGGRVDYRCPTCGAYALAVITAARATPPPADPTP